MAKNFESAEGARAQIGTWKVRHDTASDLTGSKSIMLPIASPSARSECQFLDIQVETSHTKSDGSISHKCSHSNFFVGRESRDLFTCRAIPDDCFLGDVETDNLSVSAFV